MSETNSHVPLPELLRPQKLDDIIGQSHLVGPNKPIRLAVTSDTISSMILWGPPGVGKTSLARVIANETGRRFFALSAVSAGKADVRAIIEEAQQIVPPTLFAGEQGRGAILFLDEIHRFNKTQQDFLLPYVEDGTLTLIGATTENPSFEVISALLSRMQVFVLQPLSEAELRQIVERGRDYLHVTMDEESIDFIVSFANGDARAALNLLNTTASLYHRDNAPLTTEHLRETLQTSQLRYDKDGEEHYNTISAFIKSMRASNVDAALYYLARMIASGEDPRFIARRMVIFASEDVGMALPTALVVANEVFRAVETIGLPEAQINLAHGVAYLAAAPKDRSSYDAYFAALKDVERHRNLPIPMMLRNAPTQLMKDLGYGKPEDEELDGNAHLPKALRHKRYYRPES